MNKQSTTKLSFQPPKKLKTLNFTLHLIFLETREEKTNALLRFRFGFLNADYYALNGCVQSEVNKKHAFEDTVEKKIAPLCDRSRKLSLQSNK